MILQEKRCIVVGMDGYDELSFFPCIIKAPEDEMMKGEHQTIVKELAKVWGLSCSGSSPGIVIEDTPGLAWLFEKFDWTNVTVFVWNPEEIKEALGILSL